MSEDKIFVQQLELERSRLNLKISHIDALLKVYNGEKQSFLHTIVNESAIDKIDEIKTIEHQKCEACHEVKPITSFRGRGKSHERTCRDCKPRSLYTRRKSHKQHDLSDVP